MLKLTWITTSTTTGLQPCDRHEETPMNSTIFANQCSEEVNLSLGKIYE